MKAGEYTGKQPKTAVRLAEKPSPCRSELAREKRSGTAFIQIAIVIVDDHREQARSYRGEAVQPMPT
ncbi:hypothetical protein D3C75_1270030 [compost metagenome]